MIMIETPKKEELTVNKKEILRYLGYGKNDGDSDILTKIDGASLKVFESIAPKICYEKYPLIQKEGVLSFGMVTTTSENLKKNLSDCREVIVFAATIGIGADRLIAKYSQASPALAVIYQATATAYIEALCDAFCQKLESINGGKFLRPRFSPGYGDFGVENQKEIFDMLDVPRKIGISLTESFQMMPSKSVTAVIGISEKDCE